MSEHEARQALQSMVDQLQPVQRVRRGLLGNSLGTVMVTDRPGWAYIRYHAPSTALSIVRYLLQQQYPDGTPVVVGKRHPDDAFEQVLDVDWTMYASAPTSSSVTQHGTPAVDLSDLSPGMVVATDPVSLSVNVRAFLYVNVDAAVEFGGAPLDLTANVPGIAGHRYVLVYMDLDTDSLAAEDGDIVALGVNAAAPDVPENGLPLAVVDLENGQTTILSGDIFQYKVIYGAMPSEASRTATINFIIDGGGMAILAGVAGDVTVDFDCEIQSVTMLADQVGSIVVDIWKTTFALFQTGTHPVNADSITAAATPTIAATDKDQDTTLVGWTTTINAGDILRYNVDSCVTIERVTVALEVLRT